MGVTAQKWVLARKPNGVPTQENFKCVTEEIPGCQDGEVLIQAEHLTVDPYMRIMMESMNIGDVIVGGVVAKIIESRNPSYPVGGRMFCQCGWRTHFLMSKQYLSKTAGVMASPDHILYPEMGDYSPSTALGVLGMPGLTAYFGFLKICHPKPGEMVVVNAAGGAVGSIVCQIAKISGCKVIAFAGEEKKVSWLKELGIDCVVNYKTEDVSKVLAKEAPDGVHCYFDNVGGEFTRKVLPHMALFGRISVCGGISMYNNTEDDSMISPFTTKHIIFKQLKIEGFIVTRWRAEGRAAVGTLRNWMDEGKLKYKETITNGFENMPLAFIGLFTGANIGKAIVTV